MKVEEVIQCSRVGRSLNQFQKSILQETKAKEVQWSSSLSNYTAVHIATNSSKNLGYRGLLGPHRRSCPHSLAHRHTAKLSECPSRSWGWIHQPPACPFVLQLWCACVCLCANERAWMCKWKWIYVCWNLCKHACKYCNHICSFGSLPGSGKENRKLVSTSFARVISVEG